MKHLGKITIVLLIFSSQFVHGQIAKIPFVMTGHGIYIKTQINKSDSLRFLFDTGGTGVLLDSLTAEKAGVSQKGRKKTKAHGAGEAEASLSIKHQQINLPGNISIKNIEFTMMNLAGMNSNSPMPIDGIIGYDLLKEYVTKIDFENNMLLLYKDIKEADLKGYTGIPFKFYEGIEVPRFPVTVTLDNKESFTGNAMFDSGAATTMLIFAPFKNFYKLDHQFGKTISSKGRGLNAATNDELAVLKGVSFNGFSFNEMAININVNDKGGKNDQYLGLLGLEIIKRFDVVTDYSHKMIYLKPNKDYSLPFNADLFDQKMKEEADAKKAGQQDMKAPTEEENKSFLTTNKSNPGVVTLPSGLQYKIVTAGTGAKPGLEDKVKVHYTAMLVNGKIFDSSYSRGMPTTFEVKGVITGVTEALQLMPVGSKWVLYIPAELAYGTHTGHGTFPPNSNLIFEVELLGILK